MSQKNQNNEETNRKEAIKLIIKLIAKYSGGGYVFRGTDEEYSKKKSDGINSTLYRKVMEEAEGKELKKALAEKGMRFLPAYMEENMVNEARMYFPSNASNLEILTDLQHFGGATNMIDFSQNIYVALFFACQGSTNEHGEFIALSLEKAKEINEVDYKSSPQEALEIIAPAHSENSKYRVNFQGSIFVRPAEGYIPRGKCKVETVRKELKKHVLQCIKNAGGISSKNIYNDFHGVIATQKDFLKRKTFSYLAKAHFFGGNLNESISSSNKNISLSPYESYTDYNERGITYAALQQYELAIQDFDKAISLNPDFVEAYNNRGSAYNGWGRNELAIQDFDKAISLNPKLAEIYSNRGSAYNNLEQYERAIQNLDKAISLKPNLAEAYNSLGIIYCKLGQYRRAIECFDKAISLKPDFAEAYSNRGIVYGHLGQHERAIENYNIAISLKSDFVEAHYNRGNAYVKLGQYQRAIECFDKAISLKPDFAEAYSDKGIAYGHLGQHERAIENYDIAISLKSNSAETHYNRGNAFYKLGQYQRAIECFDKAISLKPDFAEAYYNRGMVYGCLNQYQRAIEDLDKTISLDSNHAKAYYYRGVAKKKMGNKESAEADFAKAKELGFIPPQPKK